MKYFMAITHSYGGDDKDPYISPSSLYGPYESEKLMIEGIRRIGQGKEIRVIVFDAYQRTVPPLESVKTKRELWDTARKGEYVNGSWRFDNTFEKIVKTDENEE